MKEKENILGYPSDWKKYRLQDAVSFIDYGLSKAIPKIQPENGVKIVSTADITKSGKLTYDKIRRTEATERQIKNLTLVDGEVLFNWRNSPELIGKTTIFHKIDEPVIFASFILRISCDEKTTHNYFLKHLLNYFRYEGTFIQLSRRAVNQANYNRNEIYELPIFLPDYNEQIAIANVLNHIEEAIDNQQQLIDRTIELKKALMHKLFTEGIRGEPQKETEIGLVPKSWENLRFEETGEVIYGIQASVANNIEPIGCKILTNKNISIDGRINLDKINYFELETKRHFQTILQKGDLLFNWRSGSKQHVGKTAFFNLEGEYTHSSFILRVRVNKNHNNRFLYYYLNFLREIGYYIKVQTYSINAKFNKSAINAMKIALPEKSEQEKIADVLVGIDIKLDNTIKKKNSLESLFKTISHELMTGKTRVKNVDFKQFGKEYNLSTDELDIAAEN